MLYHGSNAVVEKPKPDMSRKNLDFGPGFYTTANKDQAVGFAKKVAIRKESNIPVVSVYDFDFDWKAGYIPRPLRRFRLYILRMNLTPVLPGYVPQPSNQFVFKSEKALALLQYVDFFDPGASREP